MGLFKARRDASSKDVSDSGHASGEKRHHEDGKVPFMTMRTLAMTLLVSMGGICFGKIEFLCSGW